MRHLKIKLEENFHLIFPYFRSLLMQKIQFHMNRNRKDDSDRNAMRSKQLTSSSTHQQCVHDDQLSLCVDHGHGVPSNDAYRDERGFS